MVLEFRVERAEDAAQFGKLWMLIPVDARDLLDIERQAWEFRAQIRVVCRDDVGAEVG